MSDRITEIDALALRCGFCHSSAKIISEILRESVAKPSADAIIREVARSLERRGEFSLERCASLLNELAHGLAVAAGVRGTVKIDLVSDVVTLPRAV